MKFKTYRIIDLLILCILSFAIELLTTPCVNLFIPTIRPFPVLGLLLTLVAVTRWGLLGIIVVPFNTLANFLMGRFVLNAINYRATYDLSSFIFTMISTLAVLVSFLWYKKKGTRELYKDYGSMLGMLGTIVLVNLLVCVLYSLIGSLMSGGNFSLDDFWARCLGMLLYNVFGYLALLVGTFILSKQEVLADVKEKLLKKKEEQENEKQYYTKK